MKTNLPKLLCEKGICVSTAEARRMIWQGCLRLNDQQVVFKEGEKPELKLQSTDKLEIRIRGKTTPLVLPEAEHGEIK